MKDVIILANLKFNVIVDSNENFRTVFCTYELNGKPYQYTVLVKYVKNATTHYYKEAAKKEIFNMYNSGRLLKNSISYNNYVSGKKRNLKRKAIIGVASFFTLTSVVIGAVLTSFYLKNYVHHQSYWTSEQHALIDSFSRVNNETFHINATPNLQNDKVIDRYNEIIGDDLNKATLANYNQALHDIVVPNSPYILPSIASDETNPCPEIWRSTGSCTSFALKNDRGDPIMGYDYDWWWVNDFCVAINKPRYVNTATNEISYGSISFTEARVVSLDNDFERSGENMERFLLLPYIVIGGLNDEGLAVSVMTVNGATVDQTHIEEKKNQKIIPSSLVQRLVLDNCSTVAQAEELINSYRIKSFNSEEATGVHFMVADKTGDRAVFEFDKNSNLYVFRMGERIKGPSEGVPYYGHKVTFYNEDQPPIEAGWTQVQHDTPGNYYLLSSNFYLSAQYISSELCPQELAPAFGKYLYTAGDNGFWRYQKAKDFFDRRTSSLFTSSDAWQLLDQVHYSVQDGDIRFLLKKYRQPYEFKSDWYSGTIMSMLFDLKAGTIKFCSYEHFNNPVVFKVGK